MTPEEDDLVARLRVPVRREPKERLNHIARRMNVERGEAATRIATLTASLAEAEARAGRAEAAVELAYRAGWDASAQGWNAEHPGDAHEKPSWLKRRDEARAAISPSAQEARDAE